MSIISGGDEPRKGPTPTPPHLVPGARSGVPGTDDVLTAALDYLDRGFAVVPQRAGEKKPCVRWKAYQERLPTREEVTDWLTDQFSDAGLAVVLGPVSNLFVIDVDGAEAHAELVNRLAAEPAAPKVLSGSGKPFRYHLFFRHPTVPTRAKITPWHSKLEFRGNKGIVVLPPSLHQSGMRYRWAPGQSLNDIQLPDVPSAVLEALSQRAAQDAGEHQRSNEPIFTPAELSRMQKRARAYIAKLPPAIQGQGGDKQTFTVACQLVVDFGLSPSEALPLLREYNTRCRPPWSEAELLHKLQEAGKRPGVRGSLCHAESAGQPSSPGDRQASSAQGGPFLRTVPDFVLADWFMSRPRMSLRHYLGQPAHGRARIVGGLKWAIHLAVIFQRSSVVVLPDVQLGQVVWGGDRTTWPANWRGFLVKQLEMFSTGPGATLVEVSSDGSGKPGSCPEICPLHSQAVRHGHLSVRIRTQADVQEADKLNDEGQPDEDAWLTLVFLGVVELYGFDNGDGRRVYDLTLQSQRALMDETDYKALAARLRAFQARGRLASVYLPLRLFGAAPRVRLSFRQRQILIAIHRELTRDKKSDRVDKAKIMVAGKGNAGGGPYLIEHYPGLEAGRRYVGFNGNGRRGRKRLGGRGYRILGEYGWLMRARYAPLEAGQSVWTHVRPFLKDLMYVADRFGLIVAARHKTTGEWLALTDMLEQTRTPAGKARLAACVVRIYTEEDYLLRWRRHLADCMGFSSIPDRDQEQPTAPSGVTSPAQLLAYLGRVGLSQAQAARELGTSESLLSQYINGRKTWTKRWQERVAAWIAGREARPGR